MATDAQPDPGKKANQEEQPTEEQQPESAAEDHPTKSPAHSPTECAPNNPPDAQTVQIPRRDCPQDEPESSRSPLSPQYRPILPEPMPHPPVPHQQYPHSDAWYRPMEHPSSMYYRHQPYPEDPHQPQHEPPANVRLPSIQTLLTEPYNMQQMPRAPVYHERQDWVPAPVPPPQQRYPPVVAALPLDDSRARTPPPMPQRKRGRLPKETTDFLKAWLHSHSAHPYPSEIEKKQMCLATGLSMSQVSNWMINGRRRILGPSYLSTSRSNPHTSPAVTLSSPSVQLSSPSVVLTAPTLMLRSPPGGQAS